jgi:hypothetical protein
MTLTKKKLNKLLESMWIRHITAEQYDTILNRFGKEPGDGVTWTEEDIYVQISNLLSGRVPIS